MRCVLLNRTSNYEAILIARHRVFAPERIVEEIAARKLAAAAEIVDRAVKLIRSRSGNRIHLRAEIASGLCICQQSRNLQFLHAFNRLWYQRNKPLPPNADILVIV